MPTQKAYFYEKNKKNYKLTIMKTLKLFFFITFIYTLTANAQITKGNWLLGGSGEYTNQTYKYDNGTESKLEYISLTPNFGYFLKDKFVLGSNLTFRNQDIFYTYGIGLFSRYYFLKPKKSFNLFAQINYNYVYAVSDGKRSSRFYGVKFGQEVFFNSSVGLEFAIEYERGNLPSGISDNIKAVIGFQIHLERK